MNEKLKKSLNTCVNTHTCYLLRNPEYIHVATRWFALICKTRKLYDANFHLFQHFRFLIFLYEILRIPLPINSQIILKGSCVLPIGKVHLSRYLISRNVREDVKKWTKIFFSNQKSCFQLICAWTKTSTASLVHAEGKMSGLKAEIF